MSRDSSGNYTLPVGNPVVTLTVISSTWANTTLSDIATALTGSLDRSGQGAMLAGLKLFDGVIGAPGLTWGTETTAGIYRNAAGDFRFAIGGVDVFRFATGGSLGLFGNGAVGAPSISFVSETNSGFYRAGAADFRWALSGVDFIQWTTNLEQISGTAPIRRWNESDASANNRLWDVIASGEDFNFRALTDALVATNWMTVSRTAGTIDSITLAGPTIFTNSTLAGSAVQLSSVAPSLLWFETGAAANNGKWFTRCLAEALQFGVVNDIFTVAAAYMQVERTGTTIDTVNFPNGLLQYGGVEVGYRQLDFVNFAVNTTVSNANRAKLYRATASGITLTFDTTLTAGALYTVTNETGASVTIAGSGVTQNWFAGTGAPATGNRTLAAGGICTVWMFTTTISFIWGTGLS